MYFSSSKRSKVKNGIGGCCLEKPDGKLLVHRVPAVLPPICNLNGKYSKLASE